MPITAHTGIHPIINRTVHITDYVYMLSIYMMRKPSNMLLLMDSALSHKLNYGIMLKCKMVTFIPYKAKTHLKLMDN